MHMRMYISVNIALQLGFCDVALLSLDNAAAIALAPAQLRPTLMLIAVINASSD